jgi:hypothetical protein
VREEVKERGVVEALLASSENSGWIRVDEIF